MIKLAQAGLECSKNGCSWKTVGECYVAGKATPLRIVRVADDVTKLSFGGADLFVRETPTEVVALYDRYREDNAPDEDNAEHPCASIG